MNRSVGIALLALLALLPALGCGRPLGLSSGTEGAFFPHPEGYEDARHGPDAVAADAGCEGCHGVNPGDGVRGAPTTAPACRECHEAYPHRGRFDEGAAHGPRWAEDPTACTSCHGPAGERAPATLERGRCGSCHATFPHPEAWGEAEAHGAAARLRGGMTACASCHGTAGDRLDAGTCADCHAAYPHGDGWSAPTAHGVAAREEPADGDPGCGTVCHAPDPDAAPERLLCARCHDLYPHADTWGNEHPAVTQQRGVASCAGCHDGGGSTGPALPVACGPTCHQGGGR